MAKLTRRQMLKATATMTIGGVLAACGSTPAAPAADQTSATGSTASSANPATAAPAAATTSAATEVATTAPPAAAITVAPAASTGKLVKITLVESWFGLPQYAESIAPVTKAISEKMQKEGLNIELESLVLDDHATKYPVLYSSGADFTMAFDAPWYKMDTLRAQRALVPLEDLVAQYGPKLKAEITDKIYQANLMEGHLYGIPVVFYYGASSGVILRDDLRQKYKAPEPTSEGGWPTLQPYLEAIKANQPQTIPWANIPNYTITDIVGGHSWNVGVKGMIIPDATKELTLVDYESWPAFVDRARLLRSWWEKGLINKTDLNMSGTSQTVEPDYIFPGKAASCIENEPDYKFIDFTKAMKSSNPDASLMGYDMKGIYSTKTRSFGGLKAGNFMVFNASAPKEQQVAGIQFFNWLVSSQDNMDLWLMGIEGVNYKKEANLRFSEVPGVDAARNYRRQWYVSGVSGRFQRQPVDLPKAAADALTFFSTESNWDFNPHEQFQIDSKALEVDIAKLNGVYDEAMHGLVTGQEPTDTAISKAKKLLDDAGRQQLKQKVQAELNDYLAKHP
ncbi:MAG: hypothetical protein H0X37_07895 [Herpetosiphonaceae bacterium]|nr:hypothetical protein [Herpetosiphonaceae bacterium]